MPNSSQWFTCISAASQRLLLNRKPNKQWFPRGAPDPDAIMLPYHSTGAICQELPSLFVSPPIGKVLTSLFFYALYPVVWLTIAALVYGYDIDSKRDRGDDRVSRALSRWEALPKSIRDFASHFISGTLKRYRALAEGIGLALNSGVALVVVAVIVYRLLDWGAAWTWYELTQLIGPHELPLWQIIAQVISPFIGTPSDPGEGLLITPVKMCLLAATLEVGFSQGREWRGRQQNEHTA
ncbi:hypothetical protein N5C66_25165 [Rhizobium pusense]|uniref:Uncharacterized protein n=1 Tax=Agrobacterium genomosp. 2 str. CFBP 5494 TaxID=1183436 RepID=A0A9W5F5X6_9HYPH|nr:MULTISPECIES: hypothetical protein [Agrobacterium]HCJ73457.1 hypothetical protein [Agrobacterium sp.]MDH0911851.1 hypothetical protein [Agrobacterium pusense]MDH1097922.1 hypothetical protein [Agrobacterium pusense]MDH1115007.1 hypothetical protein [Agrobacterium pusense]MDH2196455.1 hypothetical protein [Agrobacterium pusense]